MRIDWNQQAFKDIRYGNHDPAIITALEAAGQKVADAASAMDGGQYAVGSRAGVARPQGRHRASVVTADFTAIRRNARYNTLIRAMGQS